MNTNTVNVAVVDGKTITESVELRTTQQGEPVRIKAVPNGKYILAEGSESPVAPENLTIKRVGNDLHVATEGTDPNQPQLIIEDFYETSGQLVGVGEDGAYYEYISSDAEQDHAAAFLTEGVSSPQVLGSEELVGFGDGLVAGSGIGWFWPALLGLGALGLLGAAYALTRDDDDNKHDGGAAVIPGDSSLGAVTDNVGDVTGPLKSGDTTDDTTPTFTGEGTPGSIIAIIDNGKQIGSVVVDDDGKWTFTPETPLPEGEHTIVIGVPGDDGKVTNPSDEFELIVDTTAPGKSEINSITDNVGDVTGPIADKGVTDDNTPTLSGKAEAGARLDVYANGEKIGSTTVNEDGTWAFTPSPGLRDGEYVFTTVAVDKAGNAGLPSDPHTVIIETPAPVKPGPGMGGIDTVIDNVGPDTGPIGNGDTTDDNTPTLGGGGLIPGDKVTIIDDGKVIGEVIVGDDGRWEYEPNPPLTEGPHPITVIVTDPEGNSSEPSDPYVIIVDTPGPVKPGPGTGGIEDVIDNVGPIQGSIGDGCTTDDTTPTLEGSGGEPGNTVVIIIDGDEHGTAIVGDDGKWTYTPDPALEEGTHEVVVVVKDPAGHVSEPSDPRTIIVDLTPPVKPGPGTGGIEDVIDNVGPIQGSIGDGDTTDDTTPTLEGSGGEPGNTVVIIIDGGEVGTAIVGDDGKWTYTPDPALEEGRHEVVIVVKDPAGHVSEPSDPRTIIVDTTAPLKPAITSVVDDQGSDVGEISSGATTVTDDAQPDISGTGEPGSLIIIYNNGEEIGRVRADAITGEWTHTPVPPLRNGGQSLHVEAEDAAGNVSEPSDSFDFELVAGGAPAAPAITGITDDVVSHTGNLSPGDVTNDARPQIHGTGEPGSTITVYSNNVVLGTTTVGENRNWSFLPDRDLGEGRNNITAKATNAAGNPSPETGLYPITVDTTAPEAPTDQSLTDDVGNRTGLIDANNNNTTDDANPTFAGTAEAGSVLMIYDNGVLIGSTTADPTTGAWSYTPTDALIDGPHSLTAEAVDRAGNVGPRGPAIPFIVDTSNVVISITSVEDNEGTKTGPLSNPGVTDDTTPTLHGKATPGSTVNIYDDTTLLGTAIADLLGNWSFEASLTEGGHELYARVTLPNGTTMQTPIFELEVDITAPDAPTIDEVTDDVGAIQDPIGDGDSTDDSTPTLSGGDLKPGDTVRIYDNGQLIGTTQVNDDGSWSYTPDTPLIDGPHPFTIDTVDEAGNPSAQSAVHTVIVDTAAPDAQAIVTRMGKDSGSDNSDFLTNDGSAGRLIQGSLTAALAADEKVQISTDGGATWLDVVVNADGTWNFLDQNSHSDSWNIQTRVMDLAGNANSASKAVTLDTTPPEAPTSVTRNGQIITVNFDGSDLVEGDTVSVMVRDERVEHKLTAEDISNGSVDVPFRSEFDITTIYSAAIVDQAGNASNAYGFAPEGESFLVKQPNDQSGYFDFASGLKVDTVSQGYRRISSGDGRAPIIEYVLARQNTYEGMEGTGYPSLGGILTYSSGTTRFTLPELSSQVGFEVRAGADVPGTVPAQVRFFNADGVLIGTEILERRGSLGSDYVAYTFSPAGGPVSYFDFTAGITPVSHYSDAGDEIGGVTWGEGTSGIIDLPVSQTVIVGSDSYHGGDDNNVFSLADVTYFTNDESGINAGAGTDTLKLTGTGQVLDLTALGSKVTSVEIIDITGTGNNTLNLSLGDVLEQGESSLFTEDEAVQMMIKGNEGDVVNLDDLLGDGTDPGDWAGQGQVTVEGVTYNVFQHSTLDAQLLVQDGVTTTLV